MEENSVTLSPHKDNNDIRVVTEAAEAAKVRFAFPQTAEHADHTRQNSMVPDVGSRLPNVVVYSRRNQNSGLDQHSLDSDHVQTAETAVNTYNISSENQNRTTMRRPAGNVQHRRQNGGGGRPNRPKHLSSRSSHRLTAPKIAAKQRREHELQAQLSQQRNFIELAGITTRELGHPIEDVVRCFCGDTAEDGLMVQCEQCQSWQHSHCLDYDMDNLPPSYICIFCEHLPHLMYNLRYSARDYATCTQQLVNCDSELYAVPRSVQYDKSVVSSSTTGSNLPSTESLSSLLSSPSGAPQIGANTFHGSKLAPSSPPPVLLLPSTSDSISQHSMSTSSTSSLLEVPLSSSSTSGNLHPTKTPQQQQSTALCDLDTIDGLNKFNLEIQAFMKEISGMLDYYKKKFAEINLNAFDPTKMPWAPTPLSRTNGQNVDNRNTAVQNSSASPWSSSSSSGVSDNVQTKSCMLADSKLPLTNGHRKRKLIADDGRNDDAVSFAPEKRNATEGLKSMYRDLAALGIEVDGNNVDRHSRLRHYAKKLMPLTTNPPSSLESSRSTASLLHSGQNADTGHRRSAAQTLPLPPLNFAQERSKLLDILREVDEDEQASELAKCLNAVNKLGAFSRHVQCRTMEMREKFYCKIRFPRVRRFELKQFFLPYACALSAHTARNQQYLSQSTVLGKSVGVGSHIHSAVNKLRNMQGACKNLTRLHALSAPRTTQAAAAPATKISVSPMPVELAPKTFVADNTPSQVVTVNKLSNSMQDNFYRQPHLLLHNGGGDTAKTPSIFAAHPSAIKLRGISPTSQSIGVLRAPNLLSSSSPSSLMPLSLPLPAVISSSVSNYNSDTSKFNGVVLSSPTAPPPVLHMETNNTVAEQHNDFAVPMIIPRIDKAGSLTTGSSVVSVLAWENSVPAAIADGKNLTADASKRRRQNRKRQQRSPSPTTATMLQLYEAGGFAFTVPEMSRVILSLPTDDAPNADDDDDDVQTEGSDRNSIAAKRYKAMHAWYEQRKQELFFNTHLRRPGTNNSDNNNQRSNSSYDKAS